MRYGPLFPYAGARPLQDYFLPANDVGGGVTGMTNLGAGTLPNFMPAGCIVPGFDNYWGAVEFMYGQASATIAAWGLCAILPALSGTSRFQFQMAPVANSGNQARPLCVAIQQMAANQFGWFAVGGLIPVNSTASVAAATVLGIAGVGLAGANSAGKQLLNTLNILAATTTVSKNCFVQANQPLIQVTGNNTIDGLFVGAAISGTGIPAGAVVATLDPDGRRFTLSAGPGLGGAQVLPTATGGVTLTGTYNDGTNFYNIAHINRPFAQGAIT